MRAWISIRMASTRWRVIVASLLASAVLTACGSSTHESPRPSTDAHASISLTSVQNLVEKTTRCPPIQCNLIPVELPWTTWSGEPTAIEYVPRYYQPGNVLISENLVIPTPDAASGENLTIAMQRVDKPLESAFQYLLRADSASGEVAVLIFPFGDDGRLITPLDSTGQVLTTNRATPDAPLVFEVPDGVTGFFVQIQNGWQAEQNESVSPFLDTNGAALKGLIDFTQPWTDWLGNVTAYYNGLFLQVAIPLSEGDIGKLAVQRYPNTPLSAGQAYEMILRADDIGATMIVGLVDSDGALIPIREPQNGAVSAWWHHVTITRDSTRVFIGVLEVRTTFVAPPGVAGFWVQVQSPWSPAPDTNTSTVFVPRLKRL